jgi:uncharacterized protein (DUF736 family)
MQDFTLWTNKNKKEDKHPDYNLRAKDEKGEWVDIGAGWKKVVKDKVTEEGKPVYYLSCRLKNFTLTKTSVFTEEEKAAIERAKARENTPKDDFDNQF